MQRRAEDETPAWLRLARRAYGIQDDERAWRRGAEGEEAVARRLARLDASWTVLHDLPPSTSGANLDHLVIGPAGVFALNTKKLTGKVWVGERMVLHNGARTSFLPARGGEDRGPAGGRHRPGGPVTPVLVVLCDELTVKAQPSDVPVVARKRIRPWLEHRPTVLTSEAVRSLSDAARLPATWPTPRAFM